MRLDDLKIYLPKFLSSDSNKELFEGLKQFPENIDSRLYTNYLSDSNIIYQGDGLNDMLVINLPDSIIGNSPCIIMSNTCDIDIINERNFPSQVVYAPIFNLEKYKFALYKNSTKNSEQIEAHINAIKRQQITQIFYLPKYEGKIVESIIFFDRVNNYPSNLIDRTELRTRRIFTLSNYGVYLFLIKLSMHFTRVQDKVDRKSIRM